jgi:uncharacterized protein YecE (DUF72 family)
VAGAAGTVRIGISGWRYGGWRGVFYPAGLPQRAELAYAAARFPSVEINGTFYSMQRAALFRRWRDETPDGFVFAVKGPRFITHMKKLQDIDTPLANFFASGPLELGRKLGPILWQLPPNLGFDADRLDAFLTLLPRSHAEAASHAQGHDSRCKDPGWPERLADLPIRHAMEVRHPSFLDPGFVALLRRHGVAWVFADTVAWPYAEDLTADFAYLRLHGSEQLYVSGYDDAALDHWAARVRLWAAGAEPNDARRISAEPGARMPRDVYVYFDNDAKVRAPFDALGLMHRLGGEARMPIASIPLIKRARR